MSARTRRGDAGRPGLVRGPCLAALLTCALDGCRCGSPPGAAETPPAISGPGLALSHLDPEDNPSGAILLAVGGAGFGSPRPGPLGTCGAPGSARFLELSGGSGAALPVASTGPEVVLWRDGEVVLALPPSTPLAQVPPVGVAPETVRAPRSGRASTPPRAPGGASYSALRRAKHSPDQVSSTAQTL